MIRTNLIITFICLLSSCMPSHRIAYNTHKIEPSKDAPQGITVGIRPFEDHRQEETDNEIFFANGKDQIKLNGDLTCINTEKYYKVPVGTQMAEMLATHLRAKQLSARVDMPDSTSVPDYYLEGDLRHFYCRQKFSKKAAIGAQFGLIGALATSGVKTLGMLVIELSDVSLFDKTGNLVAQLGVVKKEYEGELPAAPNCTCVMSNLNTKLKEFNEELCKLIVAEIVKNEKQVRGT